MEPHLFTPLKQIFCSLKITDRLVKEYFFETSFLLLLLECEDSSCHT